MQPTRKLWTLLGIVFATSLAVLFSLGRENNLAAPPYPTVKSTAGETLYTARDVQQGQRAWLAAGGRQLGAVRGDGRSVAPGWSADWLQRETTMLREMRAEGLYLRAYDKLDAVERAAVDAAVREEMRRSTYDPATNTVTVSPERAAAILEVQRHYIFLFGDAPTYDRLREHYAITANALPNAHDRRALAAFFFWSSWLASTDRPGREGLSYTSNGSLEPKRYPARFDEDQAARRGPG